MNDLLLVLGIEILLIKTDHVHDVFVKVDFNSIDSSTMSFAKRSEAKRSEAKQMFGEAKYITTSISLLISISNCYVFDILRTLLTTSDSYQSASYLASPNHLLRYASQMT